MLHTYVHTKNFSMHQSTNIWFYLLIYKFVYFQLPIGVKRFSSRIHSNRLLAQCFAFLTVTLIALTTVLAMVSIIYSTLLCCCQHDLPAAIRFLKIFTEECRWFFILLTLFVAKAWCKLTFIIHKVREISELISSYLRGEQCVQICLFELKDCYGW